METPSDASKKWVHKKANNLLPQESEKIVYLKQKEGLDKKDESQTQRKPKGPKNPNPLSCKKSKKQNKLEPKENARQQFNKTKENKLDEKSKTDMKPKRKRVKIPAHVKEVLMKKA